MKMKSPSSNSIQFVSRQPTFGCASAILRHFLRRHKISIDENYTEVVELSTSETNAQSPNIVARLMGLDSMPISPHTSCLNSVGRSRSTNSVESWPGILTERSNASSVNSLVSFHEKPIYLREENDEFLVLSFTPDENGEESLSNWGKCRLSTAVDRKKRRIQRKQNREKCVSDRCEIKENCRKLRRDQKEKSVAKNDELPLILDLEKIKMIQRRVETECLSQNSSPISVLDLPETNDEYPTEPNSPNSGATPQAKKQSSRRKLSSNFENLEGSFSFSNFQVKEVSNLQTNCRIASCDSTVVKYYVEEDLKNSVWVEREIMKPVHAEEIAIEIGIKILDLLLSEATAEICSNFN
ncbi:Ribonuclease H [Rhynchospora pubera]|uniref:Ribonuclease H n=1 Tax=Rhynchospora pubera TaxID=906938 RepID=A0AAV8GMZ9_9POAL|nr:Ribonuclease H [Rhynchospora pubera]